MSIADDREYQITQNKLAGVREAIARIEKAPLTGSPVARSASLRSLRVYENQLVEEHARPGILSGPLLSAESFPHSVKMRMGILNAQGPRMDSGASSNGFWGQQQWILGPARITAASGVHRW